MSETVLSQAPPGHSGTVASVQMAFAMTGAAFGPTVDVLLLGSFPAAVAGGREVTRAVGGPGRAGRGCRAQRTGAESGQHRVRLQPAPSGLGLDLGLDFADGLRLTTLIVSILPLVVAVLALLLMPRREEPMV